MVCQQTKEYAMSKSLMIMVLIGLSYGDMGGLRYNGVIKVNGFIQGRNVQVTTYQDGGPVEEISGSYIPGELFLDVDFTLIDSVRIRLDDWQSYPEEILQCRNTPNYYEVTIPGKMFQTDYFILEIESLCLSPYSQRY